MTIHRETVVAVLENDHVAEPGHVTPVHDPPVERRTNGRVWLGGEPQTIRSNDGPSPLVVISAEPAHDRAFDG